MALQPIWVNLRRFHASSCRRQTINPSPTVLFCCSGISSAWLWSHLSMHITGASSHPAALSHVDMQTPDKPASLLTPIGKHTPEFLFHCLNSNQSCPCFNGSLIINHTVSLLVIPHMRIVFDGATTSLLAIRSAELHQEILAWPINAFRNDC